MPIYAYRCASCGHAKDVLQKISDPVLTVCPVCGAPSFEKQVTAAGFQLKGSGWYVTDFKGDKRAAAAPSEEAKPETAPASDGAKAEPGAPASKGEPPSKGDAASKAEAGSKADAASKGAAPVASPPAAPAPKPAPGAQSK